MQSISQIHQTIIDQKDKLQKLFIENNVQQLDQKQHIENNIITIDKILNDIPTQQKLTQILNYSPKQKKQSIIMIYDGDYQIVHKIKDKIQTMKPQARDIYYLLAMLKLKRQSLDFTNCQKNNQIKLSSYQLKLNQKNRNNNIKYQKNTLIQQYFNDLKQQQQQQKNKIDLYTKQLSKNQLLITISIYSSINKQKTHQYIFLGDHNLLKFKQKIYCLIQELDQNQKRANVSNNQISPRNNLRSKNNIIIVNNSRNFNMENIQNSENVQNSQKCCFLLIQNKIYVNGPSKQKQQLSKLIKEIQNQTKEKYMQFEMSKTLLKELRVVFGKPYLFRHLNGCDHIIIFKEIRIIDPQIDLIRRSNYPLLIYEGRMKKRKCQACQQKNCTIVSLADPLNNGNNIYLCQECYDDMHPQNPNDDTFYKFVRYLHD